MSMMATATSIDLIAAGDPFVVTESGFEFEVVFQKGFTYEDFKEVIMMAMSKSESYGYAKPKIIFTQPTNVYLGKYKERKEIDLQFFVGDKSGELCYSQRGRTGYFVNGYFPWQKVEKIVLVHPNHPAKKAKKEIDKEKLFNRIAKSRFDEKTWSLLKPESFREDKHPFYYINKVFDEYDMSIIQKAFEEKKDFSVSKDETWRNKRPNTGRHYSAEGKLGEDGIYRAWFSSEFAGCGNGDYYLLLNPKVAVFQERD